MRIDVLARQTFNSGATPAPGKRKAEPKVLATVDVERLGRKRQMTDSKIRSAKKLLAAASLPAMWPAISVSLSQRFIGEFRPLTTHEPYFVR